MTGHQPYPHETVHLGSFDPLEAPIVLDMLDEHGIFAFSKGRLDDAESQPYGPIFGDSARGRIFVDALKLADARRLVDEELPRRIAEMQSALQREFEDQDE
jgi:hypothetical protein